MFSLYVEADPGTSCLKYELNVNHKKTLGTQLLASSKYIAKAIKTIQQ